MAAGRWKGSVVGSALRGERIPFSALKFSVADWFRDAVDVADE